MAGWNRPIRSAVLAFGLAGASLAPAAEPVPEAPAPRVVVSDGYRLRADAEAAERAGRWDKALDGYLRLYLTAGPSAEVRDKIRLCLRHAAQLRRHRDPAFQQFVLSLPAADALNIYAEAVGKIASLYPDRDRAAPGQLFALGLEELDRAVADPAFRGRHVVVADDARTQQFRRSLRDEWKARLPGTPKQARQAARELVMAAQAEAGVRNPAAVVLELLCGACSGLDEYSVYVAPTAEQADLAAPIAEFAAYGILVRIEADELVIDGVIPNSWAAAHTPLRRGLKVARLNGRPMLPAGPAVLADAMRGAMGDAHDLEVVPGDMTMFATVRLPVPVPTAYTHPQPFLRDGVAYVRLSGFRDTTYPELERKVVELQAQGMRALVLDVRGNPGGLFTAAVHVAQRFLPAGVVVTTQGQSPEFAGRVFSSDAGMTAWDFPVVLLVDTKTMSAAEVVAVALKDHGRAKLVGLPTFGKGVIQAPVRLQALDGGEGKGGVLILTVATVAGPRGLPLNGGGVVPDFLEADPNRQLELAVLKAVELANGPR